MRAREELMKSDAGEDIKKLSNYSGRKIRFVTIMVIELLLMTDVRPEAMMMVVPKLGKTPNDVRR
jgi:hypothetical protein